MSVKTIGLDISKQFFQSTVRMPTGEQSYAKNFVETKSPLFLRTYRRVSWDWRLAADLTIGCVC